MLSVNEIRTNLEAIANEIESGDEGSAALLRDLSQALRGGSQTNAWAASNIYHLVNPVTIMDIYKKQPYTDKLVARLEWIRNTLIFAPLVLTWLAISQAVTAYKALIDADHNQITQPFIFLWEQGFGNRLSPLLTLGWLGFLDFVLLFAVLALTVAVYALSTTVKLEREQRANHLESKLSYTLSCSTLWMTAKGSSQPTGIVEHLDRVTKNFNQVTEQLLKEVSGLAERQKADWKAFDTLKTQLSTMVTTVTTAVTSIQRSNDTLNSTISTLTNPVRDIAQLQSVLTQNTQEAINSLNAQTAAQEHVVNEMEKWGLALQETLANLGSTIDTNEKLAQTNITFTERQTQLVNAIENERREQTEIAHHMRQSGDNLKRVVLEINQCTIELRGLNVQLYDLVRRLAGIR